MKREATGGAVVAVIFTAGIFLARMNAEEVRPPSPAHAVSPSEGESARNEPPLPSRGAPTEEVAALRSALASSQERAAELEKKLVSVETALAQVTAKTDEDKKAIAEKKLQAAKEAKAGKGEKSEKVPLDPKEAEERARALLEKTNWDAGTRALVAAWRPSQGGRRIAMTPEGKQSLSEMLDAAREISRLHGQPAHVYRFFSDPQVRARFVPVWVDAFAGGLDAGQTESVRARVEADNQAHQSEPAPATLVAQVRRDFADKLTLEQELARVLRAPQLQAYLEGVTDDPFFGEKIGRQEIPVTSAGAGPVAASLVLDWTRAFDLGEAAKAALPAIARAFAEDGVRIPAVDAALPLGERRAQNIRRAIAVLDLQLRAEAQLAAIPGLSEEEHARIREGFHTIVELVPER